MALTNVVCDMRGETSPYKMLPQNAEMNQLSHMVCANATCNDANNNGGISIKDELIIKDEGNLQADSHRSAPSAECKQKSKSIALFALFASVT